jgi:hypothetical protein
MEQIETPDPRIAEFWLSYTTLLKRFRIPPKAIPWYRRHIEGFLADNPTVRLKSHTAESIERWLDHIGRDSSINTWQYRQKVDALRVLFGHFLRQPWCRGFDWDRWMNGARVLESDHVTIARTYEMIEKAVEDPKNHLAKT